MEVAVGFGVWAAAFSDNFIFGFLGMSGSKIIFDALIVFESVLLGNPIIIMFSSIFILENPDFTRIDFSESNEKVFVELSTSMVICLSFSLETPREKFLSSITDTAP